MARHMFVTALIVCGIYFGLLVIIDHPLAVADEANAVTEAEQGQSGNGATEGVTNRQVKLQGDESMAPVKRSAQLVFANTTIVGVTGAIEMKNAQGGVAKLWQEFTQMSALQNNVNWGSGSVVVYAYYHNFNQDFSWADLSIGFNLDDLKVSSNAPQMIIRSGGYDKFAFDAQANSASDEAWAEAYKYKNLIERHTLNAQGQLVGTDVIVIKR